MPGIEKNKARGPQVTMKKAKATAFKSRTPVVQTAQTESRRTEVPGKSLMA